VRPLLVGALAAAPLEFGDLWAWAVRYVVYSLAVAHDPSLGLLLEVVSQPLPEGAAYRDLQQQEPAPILANCLARELAIVMHVFTSGEEGMEFGYPIVRCSCRACPCE
jgi:hypothetical protein